MCVMTMNNVKIDSLQEEIKVVTFFSGFVAFILKYASSPEFPLVEDPYKTLCPHIIRPPDLSAYAADTLDNHYNHYNNDILKQGYNYFKDSYEDTEYIYTNSEN